MIRRAICQQNRCRNVGTKFCGACNEACYCSIKCQKGNWKVHKTWCNSMPNEFLSDDEVYSIQQKVRNVLNVYSENGDLVKCGPLIEKHIIFLERHYGTIVPGTPYRIRDGIQVDDYSLLTLHLSLGELYNSTCDFERALMNTLKAREMLQIRTTGCLDAIRHHFIDAESILSQIYFNTCDFYSAKLHATLALAIARSYTGENRTKFLYGALKMLANIISLHFQEDEEALTLSEEAYELVSGVHGPEHRDVQDAAIGLIEYLMKTDDFSRADDFARMNYETLINGSTPDSLLACTAMRQLANVWTQKPSDPTESPNVGEEAERLAKAAYEMVSSKMGLHSHESIPFLEALCDIAMTKGTPTRETLGYFQLALENSLRAFGVISTPTSEALRRLARFFSSIKTFNGEKIPDYGPLFRTWHESIFELIGIFEGKADKNALLHETATLYKECILEYLDNSLTEKVFALSSAARVAAETAKSIESLRAKESGEDIEE